eukprot:CAMPEP_0119387742 /NCGR_PEP_ID=MMETSP1334-20130426/101959_1 /TAXON_ID=127549 /ORGANISM="Calcidiscus leptoporus, Strain RCC1130" /LENGTH=70 /DNA_ID=CAMNT_0007409543 /DNA_START=215 /DNA_END=423 /DNA_ORIENTATION=+
MPAFTYAQNRNKWDNHGISVGSAMHVLANGHRSGLLTSTSHYVVLVARTAVLVARTAPPRPAGGRAGLAA